MPTPYDTQTAAFNASLQALVTEIKAAIDAPAGTALNANLLENQTLNDILATAKSTSLADIQAAIDTLVGSAPEARDTIYELAQAFQDNKDLIDSIVAQIGSKVSQTDYDTKVSELEASITASTVGKATQTEVSNGDAVDKYVAPDTLQVKMTNQKTLIETDVNAALASMKASVDAAILIINPAYTPTP